MNFPKVCFNCSRPHISCVNDEIVSEDGTKVWHRMCDKSFVQHVDTEIKTAAQSIIDRIKGKVGN